MKESQRAAFVLRDRTSAEWERRFASLPDTHRPPGGAQLYHQALVMRESYLKIVPEPDSGDEQRGSGLNVLDIGCGNGRLALAMLPFDVNFTGVDTNAECIRFCRRLFAPADNYAFVHTPVKNARYNPDALASPMRWWLPIPDASKDWVTALSLFTHLETEEVAQHYIREMLRVLKPGGILWTTWFRAPPNEVTDSVERTVFEEGAIRRLLRGLVWQHDWGGETISHHDQWHIWCRKR